MRINKNKVAEYLLTLQLIDAGYHVTIDELNEMYSVKQYLNKNEKILNQYTITFQQNKDWFIKASNIVKEAFGCTKEEAELEVFRFELAYGLMIKG